MASSKGKVVVAMSGGVDSSVAAALLLREGYEVIGVFMRLGTPDGVETGDDPSDTDGPSERRSDEGKSGMADRNVRPPENFRPTENVVRVDETVGSASADRLPQVQIANCKLQISASPEGQSKIENRKSKIPLAQHSHQGCCSVLDAADARKVAAVLGIPLYVLNFQEDFGRVIDYFVSEYNRGRTPNPCVRCNDWLKFGKLASYAEAVGADFVASGHYARMGIDPATGRRALLRGRDHRKDQSYVLFGMKPSVIDHTLLPIGDYEKHEVRAIAEELKLPVYNKPDSQEICFVPDQDYAALVKRRTPDSFHAGEIVNTDGQVVGAHEGHQHFTIGQRRGVRVALGYPIYVIDIDPAGNRVVVGQREDLLKSTLLAHQVNWLTPRGPGFPIRCAAKIRYNHSPQPATATITAPDEFRVDFDEPQSAITPGQAVVLYDGDVVLGGGWIE